MAQNAAADRGGPAFDLAALPSIESITAETDIRRLPSALRAARAHARRATPRLDHDVKIRDFVGLAIMTGTSMRQGPWLVSGRSNRLTRFADN